jgi:hypothetical protein
VTFTLTDPTGIVSTGTVIAIDVGIFQCNMVIPSQGPTDVWVGTWTTSGQAYEAATRQDSFYVDAVF